MILRRTALLLRTARHLKISQLLRRLVRLVRVRRWSLLSTPAPFSRGAVRNPQFRTSWPFDTDLRRARDAVAGRFEFLGVTRENPTWDQPDVSQLWRYHLHYFDYVASLVALAASGQRATAFAAFRDLVVSWIDGNSRLTGDGWHPYTVSLRIVNWCEAGAYFADEVAAAPAFDSAFQASLYGQAHFLARNLETDVRGNHLLKNLRALLWASAYFEGAEAARWRAVAISMLRSQTAEQVLADGGHFERVPAYHVQVIEDLRSCGDLLRRCGQAQSWLDDAVVRMTSYLRGIVPPDGRLPLLKDSTLDTNVGAYVAPPQPSQFFFESGYAVIRDDERGDFLIADFGIPCPDYLPAHAHADLFSYELTDGAGPLIVDSGVYEYASGRWRDWFRSTAAHNTVDVAGENQSEVWGSFRVARRARPHLVRWLELDSMRIIQGEHDGYRRLSPAVTHRRTIVALPRTWLIVDEVFGRGVTQARSRIHLHPARSSADLNLVTFGAQVASERGWYSERFGEKRENEVVVLEAAGAMPLAFGYCVAQAAPATVTFRRERDMIIVDVEALGTEFSISLPRADPPRVERSFGGAK